MVAATAQAHTNFEERQRTQNPRAIVMSTSIIPPELRYPVTFGRPNEYFGIHIPMRKGDQGVFVRKENIGAIMGELWYPIHNGHTGHGFSRTKTIVIETPDLGLSRNVAAAFLSRSWSGEFQGQVLIAQVNQGQTQEITTY